MKDNLSEENHAAGFLVGLVMGGVIGAIAGVALAGDKDNEIKDAVRKKAKDIIKDLPDILARIENKSPTASPRHQESAKVEEGSIVKDKYGSAISDLQERGRQVARRFFTRSGRKIS